MKDIPKNEDVEVLVMSKSMPLSTIAQAIAKNRNSPCVMIIQNTGDGLNVKIGIQPEKTCEQILFSGLMAIHNIMDQINKYPQAKEVIEQIDLDKETMELLQQLYRRIEKKTMSVH